MARDATTRLADRLGIETQYQDQSGGQHSVPAETLRRLWSTLIPGSRGMHLNAEEALERLQATDSTGLDPVYVLTTGSRFTVPLRLSTDSRLQWEVIEEEGATHRGDTTADALPARRDGRRLLNLPIALPLGYHRLMIRGAAEAEARLIVTPRRAYQFAKNKAWGVAAQLYALRSSANSGVGDFGDLAALVRGAATCGADAVGVNPLHALFLDEPERASPYSPSSRLFLNPLYLDLRRIEGAVSDGDAEGLRAAPLVQYTGVVQHKLRALERAFETLGRKGPNGEFAEFQRRGGKPLQRFSVFQVLREALSATDPAQRSWRRWPGPYQDPDSAQVAEFAREHALRVEFHQYLQWQSERQLEGVAALAADTGMQIGLYRDLAVGIDPGGADAWANQTVAAEDWAIGAPPDAWNRHGQDWGLLPQRPEALRQQGYESFSAMLRANMRHAGALRIDHVLGLYRQFWVARGGSPADGAYIRYPFDDLIRIVALESVRHKCTVIGEDLGTVPEGFSERLWKHGILSYRLQYFMQEPDGGFTPPAQWPRDALASVSTHDLPTFVGYWTGRDIDLKQELGLYPAPSDVAADRRQRADARHRLSETLTVEKIEADEDPPITAVHRALARTPSRLAMVQLEDLLGLPDQVNMPGTVDEHPNWRRKLPIDVDGLFEDPVAQRRLAPLREERSIGRARESARRDADATLPLATYRLQLNAEFPFSAAIQVLPYLKQLGVSHVYISPILEAQRASTHGYDAVNFERINPELGGSEGFERFLSETERQGLRLIVDFVPNHMGIGKSANAAWLDLLEWGQQSPSARLFDVDWSPPWPELKGKIVVPFLGDSYGAVLERGELTLRFDEEAGSFDIWYFEHRFPINPRDYAFVAGSGGSGDTELRSIVERRIGDREAGDACKRALAELAARSAEARRTLHGAAASFTKDAAPEGTNRLHALLERQVYRLASWRSAAGRVNYRRFFDVSELAGIRVERRDVFDASHRLIGELIEKGAIHGLRIDHIDGLRDPAAYCRRLRRLVEGRRRGRKQPFYLVVEKILAGHERLRSSWPVEGTTGYEFIHLLNGLLVDAEGVAALGTIYEEFIDDRTAFSQRLHAIKEQVIEELFAGSLTTLASLLARIASQHWRSREFDSDRLRAALKAVTCCFPVYRTYVDERGAGREDRRVIEWAVRQARRRSEEAAGEVFDFVARALSAQLLDQAEYQRRDLVDFIFRFQQFTAPVMAKAFEDTLFYRHGRLLSLNEVGANPAQPVISLATAHRRALENQRSWPQSMLTTSTHDTKRGEDARARLHVLSEVPARWRERVSQWSAMNQNGRLERADTYLLYQTLVGAWPAEWLDRLPSPEELRAFAGRIKHYLIKALREGKRSTSWLHPNPEYENDSQAFVDRILDAESPFLESLREFVRAIAPAGALNSLVQVTLKLTMPGVPDVYRGSELWDFSLVDPDNRRAVDFAFRQSLLASLAESEALPQDLLATWTDGRIKMALLRRLLRLRGDHPKLFRDGSYVPLSTSGNAGANLIAFTRQHDRETVVVVAGRHFMRLLGDAAPDLLVDRRAWGDTTVELPGEGRGRFLNVIDGTVVEARDRPHAAQLLQKLPIAVLVG